MTRWEVLDKENVLDSKWIVVEKHKCKINENLIVDDFYVVRKKDFVVIVVEDNGHVCFVKQYRHGIGDHVVNLPMGLIDDNENPEETARRELLEETGYVAEKLDYLGEFYQSPAWSTSKCFVFYVKSPSRDENALIDDSEGDLVLMKIHKDELKEKIKDNEIKDMASVMALHMARDKLKS